MTARTPPLAGSPLFSNSLTTEQVYSSKPALAVIPRTIAGHNRLLYEMATGHPVVENSEPCAYPNSRGIQGEDHSGAGYGRPFRHAFSVWSMIDSNHGDFGDNPPNILYGADDDAGLKITHYVIPPSCWPGGGYATCTVRGVIYVADAGVTGNLARLRVYNYTHGDDTNAKDISFSIAATGFVAAEVTAVPLFPGKINIFKMYFEVETATYDVRAHLTCLSFLQVD